MLPPEARYVPPHRSARLQQRLELVAKELGLHELHFQLLLEVRQAVKVDRRQQHLETNQSEAIFSLESAQVQVQPEIWSVPEPAAAAMPSAPGRAVSGFASAVRRACRSLPSAAPPESAFESDASGTKTVSDAAIPTGGWRRTFSSCSRCRLCSCRISFSSCCDGCAAPGVGAAGVSSCHPSERPARRAQRRGRSKNNQP